MSHDGPPLAKLIDQDEGFASGSWCAGTAVLSAATVHVPRPCFCWEVKKTENPSKKREQDHGSRSFIAADAGSVGELPHAAAGGGGEAAGAAGTPAPAADPDRGAAGVAEDAAQRGGVPGADAADARVPGQGAAHPQQHDEADQAC